MTALQMLIKALKRREVDSNIWMLPHSTLMIILMILFTALYSHSQFGSLAYERALTELQEEAVSRAKKEVELAEEMKAFIESMQMGDVAEVSITAHAIKLRLKSPVIFDSGEAELKPDIMPLLINLLKHLKEMDNTIVVEGHTDNVPIHTPRFQSNWELSAARAFSVIYFYLKRGIEPKRLVANGFGEFRPQFSNDTEMGKALNRRIEINIIRGDPLK